MLMPWPAKAPKAGAIDLKHVALKPLATQGAKEDASMMLLQLIKPVTVAQDMPEQQLNTDLKLCILLESDIASSTDLKHM
jgi:hypothetical protein